MKIATIDIKKIILAAIIALSVGAIVLPATTSAATRGQTQVTGNITENGNPIKNAKVTVTCNSKTRKDKTNKDGTYRVKYNDRVCAKGSTVTVTASTKDGKSGSSTGTAGEITTKLNVAVVNVSVPEIGTVAAIAAAIVGGAAIMIARRRQLQS